MVYRCFGFRFKGCRLGEVAVDARVDCQSCHDVHPPTENTYQLNSPIGLALKLLKRALKEPPRIPLECSPSVLALGYLWGQFRQL